MITSMSSLSSHINGALRASVFGFLSALFSPSKTKNQRNEYECQHEYEWLTRRRSLSVSGIRCSFA